MALGYPRRDAIRVRLADPSSTRHRATEPIGMIDAWPEWGLIMKPHPWIRAEDVAEWQVDCLKWRGELLTGMASHWCYEWDGLPIDETCSEFPCCPVADHWTEVLLLGPRV